MAYTHGDPDELSDLDGAYPYSNDPHYYEALCARCHIAFDRTGMVALPTATWLAKEAARVERERLKEERRRLATERAKREAAEKAAEIERRRYRPPSPDVLASRAQGRLADVLDAASRFVA